MRKRLAATALVAALFGTATAFAQDQESTGPRLGLGSRLFGGAKTSRTQTSNYLTPNPADETNPTFCAIRRFIAPERNSPRRR